MLGNEYSAVGNSVYITFQEPSGRKTHLFGKMASDGTAVFTAEALNDKSKSVLEAALLEEKRKKLDFPVGL